MFFGKLRDNIALGKPEASDEEVLQAARLSGVESFIAGHPMGYDMPISEVAAASPVAETGNWACPRFDPKAPGAVPRRAHRAFRCSQRG